MKLLSTWRDFFTYLKTRQDAGELNVLTYREWALAVAW